MSEVRWEPFNTWAWRD